MTVTKLPTSSVTQFPYLQNESDNDIFLTGLLIDNEWDIVKIAPNARLCDNEGRSQLCQSKSQTQACSTALLTYRLGRLAGFSSCLAGSPLYEQSSGLQCRSHLCQHTAEHPIQAGVPAKASSLAWPSVLETPQGSVSVPFLCISPGAPSLLR